MVEPLLGTTRESDSEAELRARLGQSRVTYWQHVNSEPELHALMSQNVTP